MTNEEAINNLTMCQDLMLFDPMTGETHELWEENKDNQDLYNACTLAIDALKEQAERSNPKPLTIEELKNMVGEPIWTIGVSFTKDGNWAMWDIVESVDDAGIEFGYSTESREWWNYNLRDNNGKLYGCAWTAYRYKLTKEGAE